jgi:hypothetical protein
LPAVLRLLNTPSKTEHDTVIQIRAQESANGLARRAAI